MKQLSSFLPFLILFLQASGVGAQTDTVFINDAGVITNRSQAVYYRISIPADSGFVEVSEYFINDTLHSVTRYTNKQATIKQGKYLLCNPDGSVSCEGTYTKGFQTGDWVYYSANKKVSERRIYTYPSRSYYCICYDLYTGAKQSEGLMDEYERKTGGWKEYHKNSDSIKLLLNYVSGIREGEQLEFFQSGKCRRRELIKDKKSILTEQFDEGGRKVSYFPAFTYPIPPYPVKRALAGISCVDSILQRMDIHYSVRVLQDGSISEVGITMAVSDDCKRLMTGAIGKMKRWKPAKYENKPIDYTFEGVIRYYGPRE